MNCHSEGLFLLLVFYFFASAVVPILAIQRERNVALGAAVHEIENNATNLSVITDGDPTTCILLNNGPGIHIRLNGTFVINKIIIDLGKKNATFKSTDEIYIYSHGERILCALGGGQSSKLFTIRCYKGQIQGDSLEIIHKFKRSKNWCSINVIACEDGFFGPECSEDCHCDGSAACDKTTGACPAALCSAGWEGDDCQQVCTNGTYGKNCVGSCHCEEGVECDVRNGTCRGSRCAPGWFGSTCQTEMARIKSISLYTESEDSLDITWHAWGEVMDPELSLSFLVLYRRSSGATDGGGGGGGRSKREDGSENEATVADGDNNTPNEEKDVVVTELLDRGWKRGPKVDHVTGRHNYITKVEHLHHNTFYEFVVIPRLMLKGGGGEEQIFYGEVSFPSPPFRTKCKAPGHPVMLSVTSFADGSQSSSRAGISVHWAKLSDYESNCENILYYEVYYEDASKPMVERQWLKRTVHPTVDNVNVTGVHFGCDYRVKMCVLNNYHQETCCDPIKIKTREPPSPTFNHQSSYASVTQNAGIAVGVLFLALLLVVILAVVFLQRQKYSRKKRFVESFYTRNESQVGLASDLSHSSEHDDLLSQIVIHRSSHLQAVDNNHNDFQGTDKTSNLTQHKTLKEMALLSHPIPRDELVEFLERMAEEKYHSLKREYQEIPSENPEGTKIIGQMPHNLMKNRFKDVIAYDHTRVILQSEKDGGISSQDSHMDYINANYIDGHKRPRAYIATQGCKKNTLEDFWSMVWQQNARRIVMVTNLIERSSIKCQQYWPEKLGSARSHGHVSVTLSDVIKTTHYTIRSLEATSGGVTREIRQFHFTAWPDQGVPSKINQMLTFRNKVRSCDVSHPGIIVVHCSAGIGRTGAFIALDICMEQLSDELRADLMRTTATMRLQRCNLIQRAEQYIFVYLALAEFLKVGNTSVACSEFNSYYQNLKKANREMKNSGGKTSLHKQFELLVNLTEGDSSVDEEEEVCSALHPVNKDKNRYSDVIPNDRSRPYLTSVIEGTNDYINATYLDGYKSKNAYIITQMPLPTTVIDFWRLVFEHDVRIIIMLNSFHPIKNQSHGQYWPEENEESECGPFLVRSTGLQASGNVCLRDLELRCSAEEVPMNSSVKSRYDPSPRQVMLFQMDSLDRDPFLFLTEQKTKITAQRWNEFVSNAAKDLLRLIEMLEREASRVDIDLPTVVHCDDGQTLSGLFVAILTIYEKIKVEGEIDIFQTVRNLKSSQRSIISSLKQYQFLYEVASKVVNGV